MISATHTTPHTMPVSIASMLIHARVARFISYGFLMSLMMFGALLATHSTARAQTPTTITYQANLIDIDTPPDGLYGLELTIYDAQTGGTPQAPVIHLDNIRMQGGVFTVGFDAGSAPFAQSAARFVEIAYRAAGSMDAYSPLNRRHPFTAVPYALKAISAETADTANTATRSTTATLALDSEKLGGVGAAQYVLGNDARLSDARTPTPDSVSYIQNRLTPQLGSSFNITGNGNVGGSLSGNVVNAVTAYNIEGNRVLGIAGTGNAFVGRNAGAVNTSGVSNSFVGFNAGFKNTTGGNNSFVGRDAGFFNTTGGGNSFFGTQAGQSNTTGNDNAYFGKLTGAASTTANNNSFFGATAGAVNTIGNSNSLFGFAAGAANTTGSNNSFLGRQAGKVNTTGFNNTFVGTEAGVANTSGDKNTFVGVSTGGVNTTGNYNSFFGYETGYSNMTGSHNTLMGAGAGIGQAVSYATAIGSDSTALKSNTIALGRLGGQDTVIAFGDTEIKGIADVGGLKLRSFPPISVIAHTTLCVDRKTNIVGSCPYIEPDPILRLSANQLTVASGLDLSTSHKVGNNTESNRIGVTLVASVREQHARIERQAAKLDSQQQELARQRTTIDLLRQLVCAQNPQAAVCK